MLHYCNTYLVVGRYELVNCLAQYPDCTVLEVAWSRLVVMWHEYGSQEWESEAVRGASNGSCGGCVFLHQREQSWQRGDREEGGRRGQDSESCLRKQLPCWNETHHSILVCSHSPEPHCNLIQQRLTNWIIHYSWKYLLHSILCYSLATVELLEIHSNRKRPLCFNLEKVTALTNVVEMLVRQVMYARAFFKKNLSNFIYKLNWETV